MNAAGRASIDDAIAVGDVVTLNSGGPRMTVREIRGETADCEWFDGASHCERSFKIAVLRHVRISDDPSSIIDKVSDAARGVFEDLKERAQDFSKDGFKKDGSNK